MQPALGHDPVGNEVLLKCRLLERRGVIFVVRVNPVIYWVLTGDYCVFHCLFVSPQIISKSKLPTRLLGSV